MSASCCAPARGEPAGNGRSKSATREAGRSPGRARADLLRLSGGLFLMGGTDEDANPMDREGPVREAVVGPFAISRFATTNDEFAEFVEDTGYVTEAQQFGWSFVFASFVPARLRTHARRAPQTPWWCAVPGATWREPEGPGSSVADRTDHPVVHVSWKDAEAYAIWAGGRLPTEAEWEFAARGGLAQARYPWGDELEPGGRHMCNIWQGQFPTKNTAEDGYRGTAPVDAFEPNGYGLYNVAGNVWEMCSDPWSSGPSSPADRRHVMRGGSYLCHSSYCNRYRVAARTSNTADSSAANQGFRMAYDL